MTYNPSKGFPEHTTFLATVIDADLTSVTYAGHMAGNNARWIDVLTAGNLVVTHEDGTVHTIPCPANYRLFGQWTALGAASTASNLVICY